ncbi:hypothetical protein OG21DRAFT_1492025 [Imleria badia]|nr:hypothetical protein OG21DRAFT_1492025 [Imleria badia]
MSKYHDRHNILRLIGAVSGYVGFEEGGGTIDASSSKKVIWCVDFEFLGSCNDSREAVILLDEFENACKDVTMILLQILDEGSLTNSQGREVDFKVHLTFFQSALLIEMMLQNSIVCLMSNLVTKAAEAEVLERTLEYSPPELLNWLS